MLLGVGLLIAALGLALCAYSVLTKPSQQITQGSQNNGAPQSHQNNADAGSMADSANQNTDGGDGSPEAKNGPVGPIWQWLNDREGAVTALSTALLMVFTFALVAATIGLYLTGEKAANAAKDAANAAIKSNKISVAAMIADQRPWISASMELDGPLIKDVNGWNIVIKYTLLNVGKTPGITVDFIAGLVPVGPPVESDKGTAFMFADPGPLVDVATDKICKMMDPLGTEGRRGNVMFPAQPQNALWRAHAVEPVSTKGFIGGFVAIGCVTYKIAGDPSIHRTVVALNFGKKEPGKLIDLSGAMIPLDELSAAPYGGKSYAN